MKKAISMPISILMSLYFCGCSSSINNGASAATDYISTPLSSLSLPESGSNLPDSIILNVDKTPPDSMSIYIASAFDIQSSLSHIAEYMGVDVNSFMDNGDYLSYSDGNGTSADINKTSGIWSIYIARPKAQSNGQLSDEQAVQAAKEALFALNISTDIYTNIKINHSAFDRNSYDIWFYPILDGSTVYGMPRINVALTAAGDVAAILMHGVRFIPVGQVPIKTVQQAFDDIRSDSVMLMLDDQQKFDSIEITGYELAYYADTKTISSSPHIQPVYYFKGSGLTSDGSRTGFGVLVPAVSECAYNNI